MSFFSKVVWSIKGYRQYTKAGFEAASKSFNPTDLEVNIADRSFMVTGANSGVGKATALAIAKKGGIVHLICRNQERGESAQNELKQNSGNENIFLHLVDMSKPKDIVAFAESFKSSGKPLHVLINNAGILNPESKRAVTEDGLETTFATNTFGTHVLTKSLLPLLESADDPRVVIVTSGGMLTQKLDLSDMQCEKTSKFDGTSVYAQTKRQQAIMTEEYAKAYPKVHFSCMHPGWADTPGIQTSLPSFYNQMKNKLRTEEQGADTLVWLAISPSVKSHASGLFFQDRKPVSPHLPLSSTASTPEQNQKLMQILDDMARQYGI